MIPELEIQHTGKEEVERLQENVKKWAKPIEDCPLLDGRLIQAVEFAGGALTVDVNHGLGRQPRGWIITDFTALAGTAIVRDAWDTNTITFTASAACDLDLWVF